MLTFHFKPLKYWRDDIQSRIFAAHRLQITSQNCENTLKNSKLLRMLFKLILNEDEWKVEGKWVAGTIFSKKKKKRTRWNEMRQWVCNWVRWNGNIINENSLHLILIKEAEARVSENVNDDLNVMWLEHFFLLSTPLSEELHYNMCTWQRICWNESIFRPLHEP